MKLRIISRNSALALWQANFVKASLNELYPDLQTEIIGITTQGDKILDRSLDKIGGKGLFIKELELALLEDTADIAVHSLKDLPAKLNPDFILGAILKREDPTDAFISNNYSKIEDLPKNSIIGTSSPRRIAILKQYYPHLSVKLLRGNLSTRLNKLDNNEYDAIILASAGLKRLGLESRIQQKLSLDQFIPAIGQGALAVEVLGSRSDLIELIQSLQDLDTFLSAYIERKIGEKLGASCSVPIAVYAQVINDTIKINCAIWDLEINKCCQYRRQVNKSEYENAIEQCIDDLLRQGAKSILDKYQ